MVGADAATRARISFVTDHAVASPVRQGVYMSSDPHSSFFYLFTAAHGLHLFGGILALGYLAVRTTRKRRSIEGELKRIGAADAATIYWHFMDGLWVALFLLLFYWK